MLRFDILGNYRVGFHNGASFPGRLGARVFAAALLLLPGLCGGESLFKTEAGGAFNFGYDRVFAASGGFETWGGAELFRLVDADGGVSALSLGGDPEVSLSARLGVYPALFLPLKVNIRYIHTALPNFGASLNSLIPYLSWDGSRAGFSLGVNFRYSSFMGGTPLDEWILVFSGYVHIIDRPSFRLGLRAGNFSRFSGGNMGSYSLALYGNFRILGFLYLMNELELLQTGSVALASNFYGIRYKGGVTFRW